MESYDLSGITYGPRKVFGIVLDFFCLFLSSIFKWKRAKDSRKCESWHMPCWALKSSGENSIWATRKKGEKRKNIRAVALACSRAMGNDKNVYDRFRYDQSGAVEIYDAKSKSLSSVYRAERAGLVKMNRFYKSINKMFAARTKDQQLQTSVVTEKYWKNSTQFQLRHTPLPRPIYLMSLLHLDRLLSSIVAENETPPRENWIFSVSRADETRWTEKR